MKNSSSHIIRDIILFGALIILIKEVCDRTKNFVTHHKESIVHELDHNFIDHLYTAQRHLHAIEQQELSPKDAHTAAELKSSLVLIEEKYKKNSPALALLGPIGTTAVITKETQLQEKLTKTANNIGKLLYTISKKEESFIAAQTLSEAIENNRIAIKQLV